MLDSFRLGSPLTQHVSFSHLLSGSQVELDMTLERDGHSGITVSHGLPASLRGCMCTCPPVDVKVTGAHGGRHLLLETALRRCTCALPDVLPVHHVTCT